MLDILTNNETEMMYLYVSGQTCNGIMQLLGIDYIEYQKTRKSLLRKLKISRITEILPFLIENKISINQMIIR